MLSRRTSPPSLKYSSIRTAGTSTPYPQARSTSLRTRSGSAAMTMRPRPYGNPTAAARGRGARSSVRVAAGGGGVPGRAGCTRAARIVFVSTERKVLMSAGGGPAHRSVERYTRLSGQNGTNACGRDAHAALSAFGTAPKYPLGPVRTCSDSAISMLPPITNRSAPPFRTCSSCACTSRMRSGTTGLNTA